MHKPIQIGVFLILVALTVCSGSARAELHKVDCTKGETLSQAVERAKSVDTIQVTGTCKETVTITTERLRLDGQGSATLDGESVGQDSTAILSE